MKKRRKQTQSRISNETLRTNPERMVTKLEMSSNEMETPVNENELQANETGTAAPVNPNEEKLVRKMALYMFLAKFYSGNLLKIDREMWNRLGDMVREEVSFFDHEKMQQGSRMIIQAVNDAAELEFDFNRLFVGPDRLEAAPYESVYRGTERAFMQAETMAVRKFYERAGLSLVNKNREPDDHLSFELEFAGYLLEESLEDSVYYELYEAFLRLHLFQWVERHCELVREKTVNGLITGVSYLLQGLMEVERKQMNVLRR